MYVYKSWKVKKTRDDPGNNPLCSYQKENSEEKENRALHLQSIKIEEEGGGGGGGEKEEEKEGEIKAEKSLEI